MMQTLSFRKEVLEHCGIQGQPTLSPEQESACYTKAFDLYEQRAYRQAADLFTTLLLANPFAPHYWQGLAGSKQMAKEYESALRAWGILALLRPQDPQPHLHAAECLTALHEPEEARKALRSALALDPSLEVPTW